MDKNTFTIKQDATGRRYISQVKDELDKNHGQNDNNFDTIGEGAIYEIPESETCPVKTFEKYLSKLHPERNTLWQRPKSKVSSSELVWYFNVPLSEKTLGNMMPRMSIKYCLSKRYTNHCLRVTSTQVLDDANFEGDTSSELLVIRANHP